MYNAMIRFSDFLVAQINIDMETFNRGEIVGKVTITSEGTEYPFNLVVSTPNLDEGLG